MKILSAFLMVTLFLSCNEKKAPKQITTPPIEITNNKRIITIDTTKIEQLKDTNLIAFYNGNNHKTFWLENDNREKLIEFIKSADTEGLLLKDFDINEITDSEKNIKNLSDDELINYDFLLTKNLYEYIQKASNGFLNFNTNNSNWNLKSNTVDSKNLLLNFQKKDSFNYATSIIPPTHIVYKKLKKALEIVNNLPSYNLNKIELNNKIFLNDTSEIIVEIKKHLIYWKDLQPLDTLTNTYDENTELAVKKFQKRHGLTADGVLGFETVKALNYSKEDRKKEIILNMERWRYFPREFETEYIIVNIPDYTLQLIKNKDTITSNKVIVGKSARKTPVLTSKLSHLVLNPTWTIPPTILNNDVIPAAKKNIDYFKAKNITVYDSKNEIVKPTDWSVAKAKSYRYVQSPGVTNSLGLVKFMFPNKFSVYLHDTNNKGNFNKDIRALSSGCIRVQYPFEFAEYLLDDAEKWNLKSINEVVKKQKTFSVNIKKDIFIYILYWTAWSENGTLQFRDDLYDYNSKMLEMLN